MTTVSTLVIDAAIRLGLTDVNRILLNKFLESNKDDELALRAIVVRFNMCVSNASRNKTNINNIFTHIFSTFISKVIKEDRIHSKSQYAKDSIIEYIPRGVH